MNPQPQPNDRKTTPTWLVLAIGGCIGVVIGLAGISASHNHPAERWTSASNEVLEDNVKLGKLLAEQKLSCLS